MIREFRHERMAGAADPSEWTQEAVAAKVGAAVRSVKAWEAGDTIPRPHMQRRLATLFAVSVRDLKLSG